MQTAAEAIRQWFENVWNKNDASYIDKGLAEQCDITGLDEDGIRTRDDFHRFHESLNAVFDNIQTTITHLLDQGDDFSGVVLVEATHRATGTPVSFTSSFFGSVRNGQIYRAVNVVDYLAVVQQIGALSKSELAGILSGESGP